MIAITKTIQTYPSEVIIRNTPICNAPDANIQHLKELPLEFDGRGEVRGYHFRQLKRSENAYLYLVTSETTKHYEVFERKENPRYGCISYPASPSFGLWAWCPNSYERAIERFNSLQR
jgi:hypothetical protein